MLDVLRELITPKFCIACNSSGFNVCGTCLASWKSVSLCNVIGVPSVAVAARAPQLIQAISIWKDHGVRSHSSIFARLLLDRVQTQIWFNEKLEVIPIPDKLSALRRRGYSPMADIQLEFCKAADIRKSPGDVDLRWSREVKDQRELNNQQRLRNMNTALVARISSSAPILLLDDVVTTGATMRSAVNALQVAGASEIFAASIVSSRSAQNSGPQNWD